MEKVGLVVEGGGTKAAYSAGALKCFLEHKIYTTYAVGISAGSELLTSYVARQTHRMEITGIDAPCQKGVVGLRPLIKERSAFGIEATYQFIESQAPLDLEALHSSSTKMEIGLYDVKTHEVRYYDQSYVDKEQTLVRASCALLILCPTYQFLGREVMDAGLIDMISICQSIYHGNEKHIILSTKEEGYVRKPAPSYQLWLAKHMYHDDHIVEDLRKRHERYNEQWAVIEELKQEGKALVLRPSKDLGVTRYTTDPAKLRPWFQLGYDETEARIDEIKAFCGIE
jgi:predicted patatin/cPLA2 family phospholipase